VNKSKVVQLTVLAGILGLCGFLYISTMLSHDLRLHRYKKAFSEIHHPENTKFVAKYDFLGALDTQRVMYKETFPQGCDYIVGEIREYTGPEESIKAFYDKQTIVVEQNEKKISVRFIPINRNGHIDRDGWGEYGPNGIRLLESLDSSLLIGLNPSQSYFFVSVQDLEFSASERDFRCLL
jgi:hypothetical protein